MDDTELLAAIGRMVVNAAQLEYSVAELVTGTEGLRGEAREDHAVEIVKVPGEAMRQFRKLADKRPDLRWLMEDTDGLLRARHFTAHSVAQQDAVAEGLPALFVLHPKSGAETMITTMQARDNARMIREGCMRVQEAIAAEIAAGKPADAPRSAQVRYQPSSSRDAGGSR
jgi:hypothetical protein